MIQLYPYNPELITIEVIPTFELSEPVDLSGMVHDMIEDTFFSFHADHNSVLQGMDPEELYRKLLENIGELVDD